VRRYLLLSTVLLLLGLTTGLLAFQRGMFGDFAEGHPAPFPPDGYEKTEFAFARLRYTGMGRRGFYGRGFEWWATDYPKADRTFVLGVRRLTRLHTRSAEQVVDVDSDEIYNWPWVYAEQAGGIWQLTDAEAQRLRTYLLRGGFLMLDDFWGTEEWNRFEETMKVVFPERPIVEIDNEDPVFHSVYDLDDRYQIPGQWALMRGTTYRNDGYRDYWRGIYDDHGRLMVVMDFNSDVGDSWEWADSPRYPEKYSALGIRIGVNYVMYSMTH